MNAEIIKAISHLSLGALAIVVFGTLMWRAEITEDSDRNRIIDALQGSTAQLKEIESKTQERWSELQALNLSRNDQIEKAFAGLTEAMNKQTEVLRRWKIAQMKIIKTVPNGAEN